MRRSASKTCRGAGLLGLCLATAGLAAAETPPIQLAAVGTSILVNNLTDLNFGTWSGIGQLRLTEDICVGTNAAPYRYSITVTGSGAGGAYTIGNGVTALPYTLEYRDRSGGFAAMTSGTALTNQRGDTIATCTGGGQNGRLRVTFQEADLLVATAGNYNGALTLVVAPE